jgi:hypothetical protein
MKLSRLSPFIGLYSKLSRAYASQYVFISVLILVLFLMLMNGLDSKLEDARFRLQYACHGLEMTATTVASTPHYAVGATNAAIQNTVQMVANHASKMMKLVIDLLNRLILFLIARYQKLLVCILDSILAGTVGAIQSYSTEISHFVQQQLTSISDALNSGLDGINSQIRSMNDVGNKIGGIFGGGGGPKIEPFSLPTVNARLNFQLPEDFQRNLANLNVPDLEDAQKALANIISKPFEELAAKLGSRISNSTLTNFNLPVLYY